VKKLVLEAAERLTGSSSERSALLALVNHSRMRTLEVARELEADGFSYGTAAHALSRLVQKGLARRLRQGVYEVNWKPILEAMSSVVEKRENRSEEFG
jgi:predicted transcriptional regulator